MTKIIGAVRTAPGRIARQIRRAQTRINRPGRDVFTDPEFLRRAVRLALWTLAGVVVVADAAAFAGSYLGLYQWASNHGMAGWRAYAFPLMVDTFVAAGELALFVSAARLWSFRTRLGGWTILLLGLAASIGGNVAHAPDASWQTRLTWAVPPLAAAAALAVGLGILKNIAKERRGGNGWTAPALGTDESFGFVPNGRQIKNVENAEAVLGPVRPGSPEAMLRVVAEGNLAERYGPARRKPGPRRPEDMAEAAFAGIAAVRATGREPSVREVAARWLGGDPDSGPAWAGGNKRWAADLLNASREGGMS